MVRVKTKQIILHESTLKQTNMNYRQSRKNQNNFDKVIGTKRRSPDKIVYQALSVFDHINQCSRYKFIKPILSHFQQQLLRNKKIFSANLPISYLPYESRVP